MRYAVVLLNYVEAAIELNQLSDPNIYDYLDDIRDRAGMPPVDRTKYATQTKLRELVRRERRVELAFEGHHYYHDIRRWMIAPQKMTATLTGMYIEKTDVSEQYPKGRIYTRRAIPQNRQSSWKDAMYYIPFPTEEANKMKNFVNNEIW